MWGARRGSCERAQGQARLLQAGMGSPGRRWHGDVVAHEMDGPGSLARASLRTCGPAKPDPPRGHGPDHQPWASLDSTQGRPGAQGPSDFVCARPSLLFLRAATGQHSRAGVCPKPASGMQGMAGGKPPRGFCLPPDPWLGAEATASPHLLLERQQSPASQCVCAALKGLGREPLLPRVLCGARPWALGLLKAEEP